MPCSGPRPTRIRMRKTVGITRRPGAGAFLAEAALFDHAYPAALDARGNVCAVLASGLRVRLQPWQYEVTQWAPEGAGAGVGR